MVRGLVLLGLLLLSASSRSWADAPPYKTWLLADARQFLAEARASLPPRDRATERRLKRLSALTAGLERAEGAGALQRWGDQFFLLAGAVVSAEPAAGLDDVLGRMRAEYEPLLRNAPARVARRTRRRAYDPETALSSLAGRLTSSAPSQALNDFYSGQAGAAAPVPVRAARRGSRAYRFASAPRPSGRLLVPPPAPAAAPEDSGTAALSAAASALGDVATPGSIAQSLVTAFFRTRSGAARGVEYSVDGYGQIVGVRLPDSDYSETREFSGGLLRGRHIQDGGSEVAYTYDYDARGRLRQRTVSREDASGALGGTVERFDPRTDRVVRAWTFDPDGGRARVSAARERALVAAWLGPAARAAAAATAPLLDWQLDSDRGLHFVSDGRDKQYHDPFWFRSIPRVSRGWTDPNDPSTWTVHPILGVRRPHDGVDMPMPEGTQVYAARRGKVVAVGWEGGYGQRIVVQHYKDNRPDGAPEAQTVYGHLSRILVRRGQWVIPGDTVIGLVGSTGISTGPHLHFEIREGDRTVDPITQLSPTQPNRSGKALVDPRLVAQRP